MNGEKKCDDFKKSWLNILVEKIVNIFYHAISALCYYEEEQHKDLTLNI